MATCTHAGCACDNFREELVGAPHLCLNGNCLNCGHPVNAHPRRPAAGAHGGSTENWPLELEFAFSDILSTFSFLGLSISAKLYTTQPSSMACTSSGKLSQIGLVSSQSVVLDSLPGEPTAMPDVDNHCCQTGEDLEKPKTTNKLRKRKVHTVIEKNDCIE